MWLFDENRGMPCPIPQYTISDKRHVPPLHQIAPVVNGMHFLENFETRRTCGEEPLQIRLRYAAAEAPLRGQTDGRAGGHQ
jgi:hypothetical protein